MKKKFYLFVSDKYAGTGMFPVLHFIIQLFVCIVLFIIIINALC